ncbi:MAG: hypothetical protein H7A15_02010 [Sinobacteraceae bacterium]|nr:hypothetical protein [Nevskiaceae bacterium]
MAPTQIYRFLPQAKGSSRLTEVYLNDGRQISAGSVGAVFNQHSCWLIGSGTDLRILRCQLPREAVPAHDSRHCGAAAADKLIGPA